ncbi:hypothetical protein D3Z58_25460 [Clostridiaceae bacterium]|nr:hypothetical protein [Clostridiaceae bacterium]
MIVDDMICYAHTFQSYSIGNSQNEFGYKTNTKLKLKGLTEEQAAVNQIRSASHESKFMVVIVIDDMHA